jgi:uncharacterized membrane protein
MDTVSMNPDGKSLIAVLPVLGTAGLLSGYFEGVFLLESVTVPLLGLFASYLAIRRKRETLLGLVSLPIFLGLILFSRPDRMFLAVIPLALTSSVVVGFSGRKLAPVLSAVFAQLMDAVSTQVILAGGGTEKMLLPALTVELAGSTGIFMLKAVVLAPYMIYTLRNEEEGMVDFLVYSTGIILFFHNLAL